jgi:AcrR family transcriptional regulator
MTDVDGLDAGAAAVPGDAVAAPAAEAVPHTSLRIEEAALGLFFERGFKATTMREIALACGLTPGALYNHFPSKDHLLFTIIERVHAILDREISAAVEAAGADPRDRLRAFVRQHALLHTGIRKEARVANQEIFSLAEPGQSEVVRTRRRLRGLLVEIIRQGSDRGLFEVTDVSVVANSILTMLIAIADWFRPDGRLSAEEVSELHADLALRMVAA